MKRWLKKVRGILGTGLIWGTVGSSLGALMGVLVQILEGGSHLLFFALDGAAAGGFWGLLSGVGFAGLLTAADGQKSLRQLSPFRTALWGALAGAVFPFVIIFIRDGTFLPQAWESMVAPLLVSSTIGFMLGGSTLLIAQMGRGRLPGGNGSDLIEELEPPQSLSVR